MSFSADTLKELQDKVWQGSIPLHITLSAAECRTYDESLPYLVQCPRLSYLPSLSTSLRSFFASGIIDPAAAAHQAWFSFEGVPLKWQQPIGLLYDVFSGAEPAHHNDADFRRVKSLSPGNTAGVGANATLPWRLVVHFTDWPLDFLIPLDAEGKVYHDVFMNHIKEADFLRNGTAKIIMSLSKDDSTRLWEAVQNHDLAIYRTINHKFLNPPDGAALRHIPIKLYLPTGAPVSDSTPDQIKGTLKVVQSLVPPMISTREVQTVGTALHNILPTVFPSRRSYIFAQAVLHGAVLPLAAPVEYLMRAAAYADGFLHISVVMIS